MNKILSLDRDWEKLLNTRRQNTWLPKLYLLALMANSREAKADDRKTG